MNSSSKIILVGLVLLVIFATGLYALEGQLNAHGADMVIALLISVAILVLIFAGVLGAVLEIIKSKVLGNMADKVLLATGSVVLLAFMILQLIGQ